MTRSRLLYVIAFYLCTPVIILRLLYRSLKAPAYRHRWPQRFGFVNQARVDHTSAGKVIWLHAVSVGESLAAVPLVRALQKQYPDYRLTVTCMTPTGSDRIKAAFGTDVDHSYAPYDLPGSINRFLARVQPKLLIIMETELWPNTIAACAAGRIPVIIANARLSAKSAAGYAKVGSLSRPMLLSISTVAAQHSDDGQRFISLGLADASLTVTGNIKFDLHLNPPMREQAAKLAAQWQGSESSPRRVILASSTHQGEDEIILQAFAKLREAETTNAPLANTLLVLVPRHPERFNSVFQLCTNAGYKVARRSLAESPEDVDILLGDTMGELMMFYGACDLCFVGGSLVPVGGHNIIEPAAWGVAIITGPHLFNFTEASQLMMAANALRVCDGSEALSDQLADNMIELLQSEQLRNEIGEAALGVAEANRGALQRLLRVVEQHLH